VEATACKCFAVESIEVKEHCVFALGTCACRDVQLVARAQSKAGVLVNSDQLAVLRQLADLQGAAWLCCGPAPAPAFDSPSPHFLPSKTELFTASLQARLEAVPMRWLGDTDKAAFVAHALDMTLDRVDGPAVCGKCAKRATNFVRWPCGDLVCLACHARTTTPRHQPGAVGRVTLPTCPVCEAVALPRCPACDSRCTTFGFQAAHNAAGMTVTRECCTLVVARTDGRKAVPEHDSEEEDDSDEQSADED
jgi:hypothetical protein